MSFFYLVQHNYWMYFGLLSRVYLLCLTTYPKYTASTLQERYRNNKKGLPLYFSFSFFKSSFSGYHIVFKYKSEWFKVFPSFRDSCVNAQWLLLLTSVLFKREEYVCACLCVSMSVCPRVLSSSVTFTQLRITWKKCIIFNIRLKPDEWETALGSNCCRRV